MMRAYPIVAIAIVALTLAGCGSDSASTPATATPARSATPSTGAGTAIVSTAVAGTAIASTPAPSSPAASTATPAPAATATATPVLPDAGTGIAGLVLIGPQCPVVQEGVDCPDKPFEATIEIYAGTRLVTTVRSGADGIFSIALDPGTYRLVPLSPGGPTHAPEQTAEVRRGETTRVLIQYDSGIR